MVAIAPGLPKRDLRTNPFIQAALVAVILTSLSYLAAVALGWIAPGSLNGMEILAGGLNYVATFLCIKQKRSYALVGVVGSAAWSYVFFSQGLIASGAVNLYLVLTLIYGYWRWGKDGSTRPVRYLQLKWAPVYLGATGLIYLGAVWLTQSLGGSFVFWDAAILVLTILAQLLQDQKIILAWVVWTLVNIVGVILYFNSGIYFALMQQLVFGLANIWGWIEWRKTMNTEKSI